jgi:hypothetical protein
MPVGRWGWGWVRAQYATTSKGTKRGVVVLAVVCALVYAATALWFDIAYWAVGRFAAGKFGGRTRTAVSIGIAAILVAAIGSSASRTAPETAETPVGVGAVVATTSGGAPAGTSLVTTSVVPSSPLSNTASATAPSSTPADMDDEPADGESPGTSAWPGPTGLAMVFQPTTTGDRLPGEPDPALTPGALNQAVTQATIGSTICVSGWTATIRPSSSYTTGLKVQQIASYGYPDTSTSAYEDDHLISLELGGAPTDPRNLWPEPYVISLADGRSTGAHTKDGFETRLKNQVCAGTITLAKAQADIGVHWVHAYYGLPVTSSVPTAAEPTPTPETTTAPTPPPPPLPVPAPTDDPHAAAKAAGATAICADGTWSYSKTRSGTCSGHGGVHWWTGNVGAPGPGAH